MALQTKKIKVNHGLANLRLDLALMQSDLGLSRRKIRRIIDVGGVYVDGKRVRIASRVVHKGSEIRVEYNPDTLTRLKRQSFTIDETNIIYDDEGMLAINKPPGLAVQAVRDQSIEHAEVLVKKFLKEKRGIGTNPILVHRLDKETSGCLLFAKNKDVATLLTDQFKAQTVQKVYLAVCYGIPKEHFEVDCYLSGIQPKSGMVREVRAGGRPSLTRFVVLASNREQNIALLKCSPKTGRTHQIRVHLEIAGFPLVGDKKYGGKKVTSFRLKKELLDLAQEHHLLHCQSMQFQPSQKVSNVKVDSPPPANLQKFIEIAFPTFQFPGSGT